MTKTIKQVLERVYNKGFNDRCQQEKYADIDSQFLFALSVDQALKELEAIISEQVIGDYRKIGLPTTQKAEQSNYNNKILNQHIGDQRRRLQAALYGKEAEL